jgi:hypothetical protein
VSDTESKSRGRHPRGEAVGTVMLTDSEVIAMRCLRLVGAMKQRDLQQLFGCGSGTVSNVLTCKSRRDMLSWSAT